MVYWKPDTAHSMLLKGGNLGHSASNQYGRIDVGDVLWIVSSREFGDLRLINRQEVDELIPEEELKDDEFIARAWKSAYHVFTDSPSPLVCIDISDIAGRLRFDGTSDRLPEEFSGRNFQTMRKLTPKTIELMESVWRERKRVGQKESRKPFLS
jgi:hypothetical protein